MRKPVSRLSEQTGLPSHQTGLQADLPGLGLALHQNPSPSPKKPVCAGASPFCKPKTSLSSTLQELVTKSGEGFSVNYPTHAGKADLVRLKHSLNKELLEDVDEALQKNLPPFKFRLDMILTELSNQQHEKLEDKVCCMCSFPLVSLMFAKDLKAIWQEHGWKGSVPAQHFVLALNDCYTRSGNDDTTIPSTAGSPQSSSAVAPAWAVDDRWALAYINLAHLQPIMQAVDDDGSRFVSIKLRNVTTGGLEVG
jgi:hypothetical protein